MYNTNLFLFDFLQSDICHQSVYELVHSEDREELQRHLMWNSHLPAERTDLTLQQALAPGMFKFLGKLCLDFLMVCTGCIIKRYLNLMFINSFTIINIKMK